MARAQAGPDAACVVELSIRNPIRPAPASAGRCCVNDLRAACVDQQRRTTPPLTPPLAPRDALALVHIKPYRTSPQPSRALLSGIHIWVARRGAEQSLVIPLDGPALPPSFGL